MRIKLKYFENKVEIDSKTYYYYYYYYLILFPSTLSLTHGVICANNPTYMQINCYTNIKIL